MCVYMQMYFNWKGELKESQNLVHIRTAWRVIKTQNSRPQPQRF